MGDIRHLAEFTALGGRWEKHSLLQTKAECFADVIAKHMFAQDCYDLGNRQEAKFLQQRTSSHKHLQNVNLLRFLSLKAVITLLLKGKVETLA